jgi:hypothetical protein
MCHNFCRRSIFIQPVWFTLWPIGQFSGNVHHVEKLVGFVHHL